MTPPTVHGTGGSLGYGERPAPSAEGRWSVLDHIVLFKEDYGCTERSYSAIQTPALSLDIFGLLT